MLILPQPLQLAALTCFIQTCTDRTKVAIVFLLSWRQHVQPWPVEHGPSLGNVAILGQLLPIFLMRTKDRGTLFYVQAMMSKQDNPDKFYPSMAKMGSLNGTCNISTVFWGLLRFECSPEILHSLQRRLIRIWNLNWLFSMGRSRSSELLPDISDPSLVRKRNGLTLGRGWIRDWLTDNLELHLQAHLLCQH